ncbi:bifunctional (p)ppGpp synthetase/guanosine-3',5'-bis(diphosphate) 3'-pyrophosphohydrolase [Sporosarcina sp. P21c]|uniref:RelA/SpoT family protein n=1 Tax=Sporosarcina TaxID=1569 RepID=UPI000A16030A|nr:MULTISPECIES: bifunctional (p)ppGpp synthetase/guanosine-3',5'-bis(diphosphate) 3'-pyrophosphohydrolase [Sporosarcina]ARJ37783.1 (p)ppGpp synthetase [Sporosarcina ureae]PIC66235.1 bifunctional (p)ppGpp synthetase/guanosine-3',5'-bis(diphosphate) 3'-pyrophosphohydrolase [Sporosarcina sp. P16a]PIC83908.1 bifunctional (p)ppGpp synthetase/guanosine-3',5'-bis(diphosphate) 3'-pyrophosphohydrolase [Sporosarcina sp. P1]PIC90128.1 bifunctional (p)ppGpp synthetase/guanosine-3',5'-bis(diphosphate) 3'-p
MAKNQDLTEQDIYDLVSKYMNEEHVEFIRRAYVMAEKSHEGQFRTSGEPYINHPIQVAGILAGLQMDPETVAAGFLHDVVEDTEISREDIIREFGDEVAMLVDGVTKLDKLKFRSNEEKQAENHRKMFIAMAQDIRVILIKLADRLHNMRTLKHVPAAKQRRVSEETLEIFSPLAHRLGISTIKWELEDIALRYSNPQQYYRIVNLMKQKRTEREQYLKDVMNQMRVELDEMGIAAEIHGRPKHLYSIYQKMVIQKKEFNEIYDLLAVRIVVKSIKDCYAALGIIHTLWKPMPGRFKDYIAMPKQNLYQSIHTTVVGPAGDPLEVQIRTEEMHRISEFGVAAHWAYKEGKQVAKLASDIDSKLTWFREILEIQNESSNAQEFMESLKFDLFSDMVYVFTPDGDVVELPQGSVPIDFAYRVHSEIGNRTTGAKVNGKIVPLDSSLSTGDIVEILTSKQSFGPSRDWLKLAHTSQAKNKIRQYFKKQLRDENIDKGSEMIQKELKEEEYDIKEALSKENMQRTIEKFSFTSEEDLYAAVGSGGITAQQVVNRLAERMRKERVKKETIDKIVSEIQAPKPEKQTESGVIVKDIDNMLIRISKCCNPVPGDEIVGFITRGRGVSVHRTDCPNVLSEQGQQERIIEVHWALQDDQVRKEFQVDIEISAFDRQGLLNEVMMVVADMNTPITAVSGKADKDDIAHIHMSIKIQNIAHLQRTVDKIKQIKDVYSVERVMN